MGGSTILTIDGVSKSYKNRCVLHPVYLHIARGECVVLCGANGAGKSTLIKLITGIEQPTAGTITFATEKKKRFAYMPDHMNFPKELTPLEIISYYGRFLNTSMVTIEATLKKVGLWEERHQKVGSFSKGMCQRLNLAQCLLSDVDLYIFDEPTNGLDPYWVIQFKQLIRELRNNGKTILLSSHIMRDVVEIADRIAIMFQGEVKAFGTLPDIYRTYRCRTLEDVFLSLHVNPKNEPFVTHV
ncbi:ABC transporter ATP-binding protein [Geobacillus stearothermophilus]|uniref:ABC transporter ATP-binding protein n=1 Tax=Geobacillus stearothermophilus TaxID=1422 RepID=UPI003D259F2E